MARNTKKKMNHFSNSLLPTLLTVIAVIAITWYLITSFDAINKWWSLPLIAIAPGILSIVLPTIARRFKAFNSVISTGITVLLMITVLPLVIGENNEYLWGNSFLLISSISLLSELYVYHKIQIGDIIIDLALSALAAWLIVQTTNCIIILVILLITYILSLLVNCNFSLSWRNNNNHHNNNNNNKEE